MATLTSDQSGPKERFFHYFQHETKALQEQMVRVQNVALVGERKDGLDHCFAGIARLQKEVQDASAYVPAYDQKIYSEAIKALHEKLDGVRNSLRPKPKFAFKAGINKSESASAAAQYAVLQAVEARESRDVTASTESSAVAESESSSTLAETATEPVRRRGGSFGPFPNASNGSPIKRLICRMSFTGANSITISDMTRLHVILPATASHATSSGSVTSLQQCILDMSMTNTEKPFATLAIRNIKRCLIICGSVNGAAHITRVENSVIVVAARQLRMHDCKDTIIYLHANSQPIIEDCEGLQFAPIPTTFTSNTDDLRKSTNQWDQVQDFKWLKNEPNPHWNILPEEQRVKEDQWPQVTIATLDSSFEESLRIAGVPEN